jgi:hypothetical protein
VCTFFTIDGNEWQQQSYDESEDHPATEDVKFIRKTKFPAKVLLWLAGITKRIRPKGKKPTKCPTDTADRKFFNELEKEGLQHQLSSKRCKVLDGKDHKKLKFIGTTGIRKAMKEVPAKAHRLDVNFFCK